MVIHSDSLEGPVFAVPTPGEGVTGRRAVVVITVPNLAGSDARMRAVASGAGGMAGLGLAGRCARRPSTGRYGCHDPLTSRDWHYTTRLAGHKHERQMRAGYREVTGRVGNIDLASPPGMGGSATRSGHCRILKRFPTSAPYPEIPDMEPPDCPSPDTS